MLINMDICDMDQILLFLTIMLGEYAESQLSSLSKNSVEILYYSSMNVLQLINKRFQKGPTNATVCPADEEVYKSDILSQCLNLLNQLSTKDFLFTDDNNGSDSNSLIPVSAVLFSGIEIVVPHITEQLLKPFLKLQDRYFTLLTFIMNTYIDVFAQRLLEMPITIASNYLSKILSICLWGMGALESITARLALQVIQSIVSYHINNKRKGGIGLGDCIFSDNQDMLSNVLVRFMEIVLIPISSDNGITWDRVDACANTLITLLAYDQNRYALILMYFVSSSIILILFAYNSFLYFLFILGLMH